MPIETIDFKGNTYPKFQAEGYAAQFIIPFALKICKGVGYDIGCMKKKLALGCYCRNLRTNNGHSPIFFFRQL
jgi:hypothetical protein